VPSFLAWASKVWQNDISKIDNWQYNDAEDTWECAAGQKNNGGFRRFLLRGLPMVSLESDGFPLPITCLISQQSKKAAALAS
jgi:hypothetical protein